MNPPGLSSDYFTDVADLEGSLDLPVLGRLTVDTRFYERSEGLVGLAPDARLSERLYNFVQSEAPSVWVVGLGDGGVELPVAVGIAEQCAAAGLQPTLLAGPEHRRPPGMSAEGLRPVAAGPFATALTALFADDSGAQASGIQGVFRIWPGCDPQGPAIEPRALIVASHWSEERLRPPIEGVSGVVLVVPFRDEPAREITERVAMFRSMGYPLMGMVALSGAGENGPAAQGRESPAVQGQERRDPPVSADGGGSMDGEVKDTQGAGDNGLGKFNPDPRQERELGAEPVGNKAEPVHDPDPFSAAEADQETQPEAPGGEMAADPAETDEVPVQTAWSDAYGPRGRLAARRRSRMPWWLVVVLLIVVAAATIVLRGRLGGRQEGDLMVDTFSRSDLGELAPLEGVESEVEAPTPPEATTPESSAEPQAVRVDQPPAPSGSESAAAPGRSSGMPDRPPSPPGERVAEVRSMPATVAPQGESFGVLCGSFRTVERAAGEVKRLQGLGLAARVVTVEIAGKGTWNRVVVGQWAARDAARGEAQRLVTAGHVKSALLVAEDGYGKPIGPPLTRGAGN